MGKPPLQPPPHYTSLVGADDHKCDKRSSYVSKAKVVSISASILSIIVYISVFYIFDLSPSLVFKSSMFWFFLSNTLIIIIAADYGSFSSSCDRVDDPYDEYVSMSRQPYHQPCYTNTTSLSSYPLHLKYSTYHGDIGSNEHEEKYGVVEVKNMIKKDEEVVEVPTQDSIWKSISNEADNIKVGKENDIISRADKDHKNVRQFRRTVSENLPERSTHVEKNERKNMIRRWESEPHETLVADNETEEREGEMGGDKFATMTDEELNRRVEEFIQNFNRHIRLERNINF